MIFNANSQNFTVSPTCMMIKAIEHCVLKTENRWYERCHVIDMVPLNISISMRMH